MLVLSRKKNQTIRINDDISIEVLQIKGNTIRLGIKAPGSVRILRGELEPLAPSEDPVDCGDVESGKPMSSDRTNRLSEIVAQVTRVAQAS